MEDDALLEELLAMFGEGSVEALPELNIIGGVYGGTADTDMGPGGIPYAPGQAPTVYYEKDDFEVLKAMNEEELARFQEAIIANGIVREVWPGRIDDGTMAGMQALMSVANKQGAKWSEVLDGVVRAGGLSGGTAVQKFEPSPHLRPDYASLAQEVKSTFRQRLGRDPDAYEMQQLTGELTGYYAVANEAQAELERIQFEQQNTPGVQAGGTVSKVDPAARFAELFDQKYKHELDFVEDKEDAVVSRQVVEGATSTLSQMSRRQ